MRQYGTLKNFSFAFALLLIKNYTIQTFSKAHVILSAGTEDDSYAADVLFVFPADAKLLLAASLRHGHSFGNWVISVSLNAL